MNDWPVMRPEAVLVLVLVLVHIHLCYWAEMLMNENELN